MFGWLFGKKSAGGAAAEGAGESRELLTLSRRLDVPPARAFEVFVDRIGEWWPKDQTWAKDKLAGMVIEPRYGGRCLERSSDGSTAVWGSVLAFDRPRHIVIAWQIQPDRTPQPEPGAASRLDVRFAEADGGKSEILLVHRDFPRHGEGWEKYKAEMTGKSGWPRLLGLYAEAVGRSA